MTDDKFRMFTPRTDLDLTSSSILITGGTGSFGQAFVRRLLQNHSPARLVIYSRDEQKQFEMARQLPPSEYPCLRYFIGDIRDKERLQRALNGIDIVVHAAAMKHVPVAEYNPIEAVKTNIFGAENLINSCIDLGVKKLIALSTDKAANPINLYGATKLCSDKLLVAANNLAGSDGTIFSVVRYGNVLGSRGSIIPFFKKLISEKVDALPVTDERMTRFWISIDQGVDFVLQCIGAMKGGEVFVPKIPSMSVVDMIEAIAPGYPTKVVGIRPGEKLHEHMITVDDVANTREFENCYSILPANVPRLQNTTFTVFGDEGRTVPEGFEYRSDLNDWWLSAEDLHHLAPELGEQGK